MSADIRLAVGFWQHPKVRKLEKRLGLKGVRSLQILWCWCALNRPSGTLAGMDAEDVELAADWRGKTGAFFEQCLGVWIDEIDGVYQLHEWEVYNPWQAASGEKAEAYREKKRKAAMARWGKKTEAKPQGDMQPDADAMQNDAPAYAEYAECNAQGMQVHMQPDADAMQNDATLTHTYTKIKGNLRIPPISPQGECEGGGKKPRKNTHAPEKPKTGEGDMQDEPGIEFHELREYWNEHMRPEGPLAGFAEYKTLKKARDGTGMSCWPGLGVIQDSAERRKSLGAWNPGYEPGLAKFLKERSWLAPMPQPRASPPKAHGNGVTEQNMQVAARVLAKMQNETRGKLREIGDAK